MSDATENLKLQSNKSLGAKSIDRRHTVYESVVVPVVANIATATEIDMRGYAGGTVLFRAGETITTLTFYVAEKDAGAFLDGVAGTYEQLYNTNNAAVSMTVAADRAYPLPDECFSVHFLKLIGNAAAAPDVCLKG